MAAAYAPRHRRDVAAALGPISTPVAPRVVLAAFVLVAVGVAVVVATR